MKIFGGRGGRSGKDFDSEEEYTDTEEYEEFEEEYYEEDGEYAEGEEDTEEYDDSEDGEYDDTEDDEYDDSEDDEYDDSEEGEYDAPADGEFDGSEGGEYDDFEEEAPEEDEEAEDPEEDDAKPAKKAGVIIAKKSAKPEPAEEEDEEPVEEEEDDEEEDDDEKAGFFGRIWNGLVSMSGIDRMITFTGILVVIAAIVVGIVFLNMRNIKPSGENVQQTASGNTFVYGSQISGIDVIGGNGIDAVTDALVSRIQANAPVDEEEEEPGYTENDYSVLVNVVLNMVSVEKDLKVKFVNSNTGKLVPNVPFSITVVKPDKTSEIWTDDDMDGIIYKSDIAPGNYTVTINALEDEKYKDYTLASTASKATVKSEITYEKVDVKDEIKDEKEIDAKKEDTAENDTVVESVLTDTVAWVTSTQKPVDAVYTEVLKSAIPDPLLVVLGGNFMRTGLNRWAAPAETDDPVAVPLTGVAITPSTLTLTEGDTASVSASLLPADTTEAGTTSVTYTSGDSGIVTVDPSTGAVTAVAAGSTTITVTAVGSGTYTATCAVTVNPAAPAGVPLAGVALSQTSLDMTVGDEATLTATPVPSDVTESYTIAFTSSDPAVATVGATDGKVTAVAEGTATITVTATGASSFTATCSVTVAASTETRVITLDKTTIEAAVSSPVELNATITNTVTGGSVDGPISASSSDTSVAEVSVGATEGGKAKIVINPKAVGTAIVTVSIPGAAGVSSKTCTVTVSDRTITVEKTTMTILTGVDFELKAEINSTGGAVTVESSNAGYMTATVTTKTESGKTIATIKLRGVAESGANTAILTIKHDENDVTVTKTVTIKVENSAKLLKTKDDEQYYVLIGEDKYREATYADYYDETITKFYLMEEATIAYTGWQTIDGKVYYFDATGKFVTGTQVIQGAKYTFDEKGAMITGNGAFGIDVSKWNGTIDWNAVKNSGVNYVIIRCGYRGSSTGVLVEDPKFATNIKGATSAGLKVGVYFFSQATNKVEAVEEASMTLELIKKYTIKYPVFLDVEGSGGRGDKINKETRTEVIKAFCETIQNAGYTAGVYANKSWLTNKIDTSQLTKYKIWLAQYASSPTYTGRYDLWQYMSTGKVTGISGDVDLNWSYLGY